MKILSLYPRYHNDALDYIKCEVSDDRDQILEVVEAQVIADIAELVAEFQPSFISIQASFRASAEYQAVERFGLPVYSVRG